MAITTIDDKHLSNIATAIRQKSGVEDTFKPSEMASAIKNISGGNPILEDIVVSPSTSEQTITPSVDYDGINQVKVNAVTSKIDTDIQPQNIKKGINILGVEGTIEERPEPKYQNKIANPATAEQIIFPDAGYDALTQVKINAVTKSIDSNIKPENILQGVSILGVEGALEPGAEVVKKYKPRHISFYSSPTTSLEDEIAMLDTSLVEEMSNMFNFCNNIKKLDLSSFDTSSAKGSMERMFAQCTKLEELKVSNFNTSQITSMTYMFESCKFSELDLSNFDTSNVTSMSYMFENCSSLKKIDIRNFTFEKVNKSYTGMFNYVPSNCLIIVKDDERKQWLSSKFSSRANYIKTVAEYQAEGGV